MEPFQVQKDMHAAPTPQYGYTQVGAHVGAYPPQPPLSSSACTNNGLGFRPCSDDLSMYPDTRAKDNNLGPAKGQPAGAASSPYCSANTHIPMSSYRPASCPPTASNGNISPGMASASQQPATCTMNEQWWCLIFCWLTIPSIVASFLPLCRAGPRFPDRNYKRGWIGNVVVASVLTVVWIIAIGAGSANARSGRGGGGGGGCTHSELAESTVCSDGSGFMSASFSDGTSVSSGNRKLLFEVLLEAGASALTGGAS